MSLPRLIRTLAERAGLPGPAQQASQGLDVIGDIAIFRTKGTAEAATRRLARALIEAQPNIRCVFEQEGGIEGEYRLRRLRHLAGEKRTMTAHRESGCVFKVDVRKSYFSPRLSTERLRIAKEVSQRERVLNMFAGVGPFSIVIVRRSRARVTSCELNRYAARLHAENVKLNKLTSLVEVLNCDASELREKVDGKFDRILMPHPSAANRYLPDALSMAKEGGLIHYYRHVLGRSEDEGAETLRGELAKLLPTSAKYRIRKVREVGPRWLEMAADIRV